MPRISIAVPPQGRMIELDTDDGWMKVNYQQGGWSLPLLLRFRGD